MFEHHNAPLCAFDGCMNEADFRAPLPLTDTIFYCLEHIRLINKKWNYFEQMDPEKILAFKESAVHGHRPTWRHDDYVELAQKLQKKLSNYNSAFAVERQLKTKNPLSTEEKNALNLLELTYPATKTSIKKNYKRLAKSYHPDLNNDCKSKEEKLKRINQAYSLLIKSEHF